MLRTLRPSDSDALFQLLQRHFPAENALLGFRPDAFHKIVRRVFRLDSRIVLGFLDLVHRPVVKPLVIEEGGQLAATTLLTFTPKAGYVSTVMVDDAFRRRGFARKLLAAAAKETRRTGRHWVVLDVLSDNAPARTLYTSVGYRPIQHLALYASEPVAPVSRGPDPPPPAGLRPMVRSDAKALTAIDQAERPEPVSTILPAVPQQFFVPPLVTMGLRSQTAAWVVDQGHGVQGFIRATVSDATESGNLTKPLLGPSVPAELGAGLVGYASEWIRRRGPARIVTEVPDYCVRGIAALTARGFVEKLTADTMALSLDA